MNYILRQKSSGAILAVFDTDNIPNDNIPNDDLRNRLAKYGYELALLGFASKPNNFDELVNEIEDILNFDDPL